MKLPTCIYVWTGDTMQPMLHFARLAETSFTAGQAYRLIVAEEGENKAKRTKQQNDKMWAMLGEWSEQVKHCDRMWSDEDWKHILMHAWGKERRLLPSLDGKSIVPAGGSTSKLTISEMAEFIEFIYAEGMQRGVQFASDQGLTWDRNK